MRSFRISTNAIGRPENYTSLFNRAGQHVNHLLNQLHHPEQTAEALADLHRIVDALPLSTSDYAVTRNRLANAHHYLQAGEQGAARYELLLIRGDMNR